MVHTDGPAGGSEVYVEAHLRAVGTLCGGEGAGSLTCHVGSDHVAKPHDFGAH